MEDNSTFKLGLFLLRLSGHNVMNSTIKNDIAVIFSIILSVYFFVLGILEQIFNFNISNIPKTFDVVTITYLVRRRARLYFEY